MYRLYLHYENGTDVRQDSNEAMKWLRLASEHRHKQAQQVLSQMEQRQRRAYNSTPWSLTNGSTSPYPYRSPQSSQQDLDAAYQRAQEQAQRQMRNYEYNLRSRMGAYGLGY